MKITVILLFLFYIGCFSLKGQSEMSYSFEWSENDSVVFKYYPFPFMSTIDGDILPFDFKLYRDTLFMCKKIIIYDTLIHKSDIDCIPCKEIVNKDTIDWLREFIRLFIVDKTEHIVLKDAEQMWHMEYTVVVIQAYTKGINTYKEEIIMYPEREYNPKFLQLCDLFFSIARGSAKNAIKRK